MGRKFYIFLFITVSILSCKKDNTKIDIIDLALLVNKQWKVSGIAEGNFNASWGTDFHPFKNPYDEDDFLMFKPDSTYTFNANIMKAPGSTRETLDSGTWTVIANKPGETHLDIKSSFSQPIGNFRAYSPTKVLLLYDSILVLVRRDEQRSVSVGTTYNIRP